MEAAAAAGNHNIDGTNTTGVINCTNTTEMSVAGVANAIVNANINQDGEGAVDALVQVSVHMHTLFYKYQILPYQATNYCKPELFNTHALKYSGASNYKCKGITVLIYLFDLPQFSSTNNKNYSILIFRRLRIQIRR